jgi:hypothetical protein
VPNKGISKEAIDDIRTTLTHDLYAIDSKIVTPLVVISGLSRSQYNTRTQYFMAEQCGVSPENVILIPYEQYLDDLVMVNLKRVRLKSISKRTQVAISRLGCKVIAKAVTVSSHQASPNPAASITHS